VSAVAALGRSVLAMVVLTVILGFAYPLLVTGVGQLAFRHAAEGSLLSANGHVVGSRLAAQAVTSPRYFHSRPSATTPAYNAGGTTFSNLGPTNPALSEALATNIAAVLRLERPYVPGLTAAGIPVDAVTTSGSGIDPDISPAYAQLQAHRIAATRRLSLTRVQSLIESATDKRSLGFFGEPGVNVLVLNLALDKQAKESQ
jgi:potassium-transporting ATPase KdpC subunit